LDTFVLLLKRCLNGGLSTFTGVIFYLGLYTFTQVSSTFTTPGAGTSIPSWCDKQ